MMVAVEDLDAWTRTDLAFQGCMLRATNNELLTSLFSVIETGNSVVSTR